MNVDTNAGRLYIPSLSNLLGVHLAIIVFEQLKFLDLKACFKDPDFIKIIILNKRFKLCQKNVTIQNIGTKIL